MQLLAISTEEIAMDHLFTKKAGCGSGRLGDIADR